MSIGSSKVRSPKDLAGKRVAHGRHPLPVGVPEDDPRQGGRGPRHGQGDQRRLQPRAGDALQEGRRDARRVLELRGRRPAPARQGPAHLPHGGPRRADLRRADLRRPPPGPRPARRLEAAPLPPGHGARPPAAAQGPRRRRRRAAEGRRRALAQAPGGARSRRRCRSSSPATPSTRSAGRTPTPGAPTPSWMFESKLLGSDPGAGARRSRTSSCRARGSRRARAA